VARLELRGVRKSFQSVEVIHGVDLTLESGAFTVFVGPSGCGKSTLLRMIAGLESISEGKIKIGARVVNNVAPRDRDRGGSWTGENENGTVQSQRVAARRSPRLLQGVPPPPRVQAPVQAQSSWQEQARSMDDLSVRVPVIWPVSPLTCRALRGKSYE